MTPILSCVPCVSTLSDCSYAIHAPDGHPRAVCIAPATPSIHFAALLARCSRVLSLISALRPLLSAHCSPPSALRPLLSALNPQAQPLAPHDTAPWLLPEPRRLVTTFPAWTRLLRDPSGLSRPQPAPGRSRDGYHEYSPVPTPTITVLSSPARIQPRPVSDAAHLCLQAAATMHPYSRPSPRTASPASNLQTNPTRTNNQRHTAHDTSPYSTTPPYSDRGVDESESEMMSRGEHVVETDQKHYLKVNQVIQVRTAHALYCLVLHPTQC